MKKQAVIILLLLLSVELASAAKISGTVYDYTLNRAGNVILEVNSSPRQQYISKDGTYDFELSDGSYILTARSYNNGRLVSSDIEYLNISGNGNFVIDIIMFPSLDEEENLFEDIDINLSSVAETEKSNHFYFFMILSGLLIFGVLVYIMIRKKRKPKVMPAQDDDVAGHVLLLIKKHRRMTQKEIRKEIPMSEAKISLVLTELEAQGTIKKVKKGRGNVIILK